MNLDARSEAIMTMRIIRIAITRMEATEHRFTDKQLHGVCGS